MGRTYNNKACGVALGIDPGQLSREAGRTGFPADVVGGRRLMDPDEVRAWRAANIKPSARAGVAAGLQVPAIAVAPAVMVVPIPVDDARVKLLLDGDASPVEISKATLALAARQIGLKIQRGELIGAQDLDGLKKSMEELRKGDQEYLELAVRRGQLLERSVAIAVVGACCQRLRAACAQIENTIALQVEEWLGSAELRELAVDARRRVVRETAAAKLREVLRLEADQVDALLDQARREEAGEAEGKVA